MSNDTASQYNQMREDRLASEQASLRKRLRRGAFYATTAELLFFGLPLLVIGIVSAYENTLFTAFANPEWSFADAVMFGQGMMKLISAGAHDTMNKEACVLASTMMLVLGVVPSLIVLLLILQSDSQLHNVLANLLRERELAYAQLSLFVIGTIAFYWCSFVQARNRN